MGLIPGTNFYIIEENLNGGDNAAVAVDFVPAGTTVRYDGRTFKTKHDIPEGHRVTIRPITRGEPLLSWGEPMGDFSYRDVEPGEFVLNAKAKTSLTGRIDAITGYDFSSLASLNPILTDYEPQDSLPSGLVQIANSRIRRESTRSFEGYYRSEERGAGTDNYLVVLDVDGQTGNFTDQLADEAMYLSSKSGIDGVVSLSHKERLDGNHAEKVMRTLAGIIVHPNVGGIVLAGYDTQKISKLTEYMRQNNFPLDQVPYLTLDVQGFDNSIAQGKKALESLVERAASKRTTVPSSHLCVGFECGGSDAFSGITSNVMIGEGGNVLVNDGATVIIAETDELYGTGALKHMLQNVSDLELREQFIEIQRRFEREANYHGQSGKANPSAGNILRGLLNIDLKSVAAARKKHPDSILAGILEYGERYIDANLRGYLFSDTPGNDLSSIGGLVGSGANIIYFSTGNGSVTNNSLVKTIKLITNTGRYQLMLGDFDFDAGRLLKGESKEVLTAELVDLTLRAASGEQTVGQNAAHKPQLMLWSEPYYTEEPKKRIDFSERTRGPHIITNGIKDERTLRANYRGETALVMPTSVCSSRKAAEIVESGRGEISDKLGLNFATLVHDSGCGSSGTEEGLTRLLLGYSLNTRVARTLYLEHGCEKVVLDYVRAAAEKKGMDLEGYGWDGIQREGGTRSVGRRVMESFLESGKMRDFAHQDLSLSDISLGIIPVGDFGEVENIARLVRTVVGSGGTAVVANNNDLLKRAGFGDLEPSLTYGQIPEKPGLHVMLTTEDLRGGRSIETSTGMAATKVDLMYAFTDGRPTHSNSVVPIVWAGEGNTHPDIDYSGTDHLDAVVRALSGDLVPKLHSLRAFNGKVSLTGGCDT